MNAARHRARLGAALLAWAALACDEGDPCARCGADERCVDAACEAVCLPPAAPRFAAVPVGITLSFPEGAEAAVTEVGGEPAEWQAGALTLTHSGAAMVHARWRSRPAACAGDVASSARYDVVERLPAADEAGAASDAVALDDARIVAWADGWVKPVAFGTDLDPAWEAVEPALGPASGLWHDAVSLGNGGALTFTFAAPFGDGPGLDLAVFENGFTAQFLELGLVEVSSDGHHFARFSALSIQQEPVAAYGTVDASELVGVAGRYAGGYGNGFDLAWLAETAAVLTGRVDLGAIRFVRVVDIVGDGTTRDAFGAPLYDPTPTFGPAGFDVEAIAVLREE